MSRQPASKAPSAEVSRLGRYKVVREIGRGSMGRVFLGVDPRIDRKVALKVLDPSSASHLPDPGELRRRFVAEARAAGRLNHPNIVTVYDAGLDPATQLPYLAMEWVDGDSLAQELSRGPFSLTRAVEIVRQVGDALDHAHRRGLVHRDVKPDNILITEAGLAKLTDFGVAKLSGADLQTTGGQVFGTPAYMSPEQIQGEAVDLRSDLFSLGACLYELITGEAPFRADRLADVAYRIVHVDPPLLTEPEMPAINSVLRRALAKAPEDRFASAGELTAALSSAADPEAADGHDSRRESPEPTGGGPSAPAASAQRRRRILWGTLAVGLGAGLVLAYVLVSRASQNRTDASGPAGVEDQAPLPAGDLPSRRPGKAIGDAAGELEAAPAPVQDAVLRLVHVNRLRRVSFVVSIDGQVVWSDVIEGPKNPLRRPFGSAVAVRIPVAAGEHEIVVRLRGSKGKLDERARIAGTLEAGEERQLRVVLALPPGRSLRLQWVAPSS